MQELYSGFLIKDKTMGKYIVKRLLFGIPTLLVVSFFTFILVNSTSIDPAYATLQAQGNPVITEEMIEMEREALGLNGNFLVRYGKWVNRCLHLDFGFSYSRRIPVSDLIGPAYLNTLKLTFFTALVMVAAALIFGVLCAMTQGKLLDKAIRFFVVGIGSMPSFWIGLLLLVYVSVKLDFLPVGGMNGPSSYILPVTVLSIGHIKFHFRLIRNAMIQNQNEGYVLYERASGIPESRVILHILRNSLQTAIASICMAIPAVLAGTTVVENLFSWPGMGRLCVDAIMNRDVPIVQTYVILIAVSFILFNIFGDIVNAMLNPRLRED